MFKVAGNHDYTSHGSGNRGICLQLQGIMIIHPMVVVMWEYV